MKISKGMKGSALKQFSKQSQHNQSPQRVEQSDRRQDTSVGSDSAFDEERKGRKVTQEDIESVQNLIEKCLQLYMNEHEVIDTLWNKARIEPEFTTLLWQKLEEQNAEFFKVYRIRLMLKNQILAFNELLEQQYHLMELSTPSPISLDPAHNGIHHIKAVDLSMGYPILQQPKIPAIGHPQIAWNTSLSEINANWPNLQGLGALGSYSDSPFLQLPDSDILPDSPEQNAIVAEYFVDHGPGPESPDPPLEEVNTS